VKVNVDLYSAF